MKCDKCSGNMHYETGGDSGDFSYMFDEWMECEKCGHTTDVSGEELEE